MSLSTCLSDVIRIIVCLQDNNPFLYLTASVSSLTLEFTSSPVGFSSKTQVIVDATNADVLQTVEGVPVGGANALLTITASGMNKTATKYLMIMPLPTLPFNWWFVYCAF